MLSTLRVFLRLPALILVTAVAYLTLILIQPCKMLAPAWRLRQRNRVFRTWARGFGRILGMRVEVEGEPPAGPFFLVSNHVSYVDIMLLASQVHGAFVAKLDLRSWPLMGRIMATADTIFIDRGARKDVLRVLELMDRELHRGLGVVLFPEGTSSKGDEILRFRAPLLEFAAGRDYPVHYAALSYTTPAGSPPAQQVVSWWGDAPFLPHVLKLLRLPRFEARLVFGSQPLHGTDRKDLAARLHTAVSESFSPMA